MKKMVMMAVLMATLLLLNGVALACYSNNYCYEVVATNVDDPEDTETLFARLSYDCVSGIIQIPTPPLSGNMSVFFDSMNEQALGFGQGEAEGCVGYFKFHGDDQYVITGIGYCDGRRWNLRGHRVDSDNPNCEL
jgi:hypothetical protein